MDSRQLEAFAAVAREQSFTAAARRLHVVQSAVSATIAALEADIGQRLFDRTTRQVRLTAAGHALLPWALRIGDDLRAARDAIDEVGEGLSGSLRIGYMTGVLLGTIPGGLGLFHAAHPRIAVHLTASSSGTSGLLAALRRGDLDLAFLATTHTQQHDLDVLPIDEVDFALAAPATDALVGRPGLRLEDIAGRRFIDSRPGFGNRTATDDLFTERGLHRNIVVETADLQDTAALITEGLGIGFLPTPIIQTHRSLHAINLEGTALTLGTGLASIRARTLTAATRRFLDFIRTQQALTHTPFKNAHERAETGNSLSSTSHPEAPEETPSRERAQLSGGIPQAGLRNP